MKKLFAVLMAMAMVVSMAACAAPAETEAAPSADVEMKYMTADETEAVLGNTDYVIVDVRKAADYAEGHIPGSVSVDMDAAVNGDTAAGEAAMKAAFDGKDSTLILVCYSGKKYAQASTNALSAIGYDMSKYSHSRMASTIGRKLRPTRSRPPQPRPLPRKCPRPA